MDIAPPIQKLLIGLPDEKRQLFLELRELMLSAAPGITESLKWGQLTFNLGKKSFAFIYTYKNLPYVNLGFFFATSLSDPKSLFEGTGKGMRHIKIYGPKDIPKTQIKKWVKETVMLIEKGV